ncbi:MAG TPA: DNA replication and repair protein RecF [Solirubrobacterales bacterium]
MLVETLDLRGFRNLTDGELSLDSSLTVLHGPNGAGKTNLLEALYFGLSGRSCRTRAERETIRFGESLSRVEVVVADGSERRTFLAAVDRGEGRRHTLDGSAAGPDAAAKRPALALFMPDRLALVKGPPAARRGHLDRLVPALWPARAELRPRFGRALAQRNALVARVRAGASQPASLDAWDMELATAAVGLIGARSEAVESLAGPFRAAALRLGLPGEAELEYRPRSEADDAETLAAELRERRAADLDRGYTTHGPQYDELHIGLAGRSVRRYGSQGQQRLALLALIFAERELLLDSRGAAPLLLLDDVMSELDPERRELLTETVLAAGQALLTATDTSQLPDGPRRELRVRAGRFELVAGSGAVDANAIGRDAA